MKPVEEIHEIIRDRKPYWRRPPEPPEDVSFTAEQIRGKTGFPMPACQAIVQRGQLQRAWGHEIYDAGRWLFNENMGITDGSPPRIPYPGGEWDGGITPVAASAGSP